MAFAGAVPLNTQTCAEWYDVTEVSLPATTDAASFIYPYQANATVEVPAPLLSYLGSLSTVSDQFPREQLTACQALPLTAIMSAAPQKRNKKREEEDQKVFEGPRQAAASPYFPLPTSLVAHNESMYKRQASGSGTGTAVSTVATLTSLAESSVLASTSVPALDHTTASLVVTITGRAVVTPASNSPGTTAPNDVPQPIVNPTTTPPSTQPATVPTNESPRPSSGGHNQPSSASDPSPESGGGIPTPETSGAGGVNTKQATVTQKSGANGESPAPSPETSPASPAETSGPNISNLLGGIGDVASTTAQAPVPTTSAGPDVSNLLGQIGQVASQTSSAAATVSEPAGAGNSPAAPLTNNRPNTGAAAAGSPTFSAGSTLISTGSDGQYHYGSSTLVPGSTYTFGSGPSATEVVLQTSNSVTQLVVGSTTAAVLPSSGAASPAPAITVGGTVYSAASGSPYIVAGSTLSLGSALTIDGTTVSLVASNSAVVINGVTQAPAPSDPTGEGSITVGGTVYSAASDSPYVIAGQTLSPGSAITVDGTTVSLEASGATVVINGVTQTPSSAATQAPILTIGGATYTANSGSSYLIDGQTLTPGAAITVSGTTISLDSSDSTLVVNGVTETLSHSSSGVVTVISGRTTTVPVSTSSTGLGGYIQSGLSGGTSTGSGGPTSSASSNASSATRPPINGWGACLVVGLTVMIIPSFMQDDRYAAF